MNRLLLGLSLALVALSPSRAGACPAIAPGLSSTLPEAGKDLWANAAIQFYGFGLSADKLVATIDGAAATLVPSTVVTSTGAFPPAPLLLALQPTPKAGQLVAISGNICASGTTGQGCDVSLSFPVIEPDTAAPGAIDKLTFDVFDYPDGAFFGTCIPPVGLFVYARLTGQESPAGSDTYWEITGYDSLSDHKLLFSQVTARSKASEDVVVDVGTEQLKGVSLPSGLCLEARSFDVAGNQTATVTQCKLCRYRDDDAVPAKDYEVVEPAWTSADVVAGGSCDPGVSGGSGQAGTSSGQAGTSSGQSGSSAGDAAGSGGSGGSGGPALDGVASDDDGGCGCRTTGGRREGGGALAGLATLAMLAAGRRRRDRLA